MGFFDNKTVTLFNRSYNADTEEETYYPTLLNDVDLVETKGANVSKSGMDSADAASLYVKPELLQDGCKKYLPAKEWLRMPDKCKEFFFTFASGEDFFVGGDTSGEEYTEEFFSCMKEKYDNCFKVTNVDRYELIPHLEVGGA